MSATTTTKFYVQAQLAEGDTTWANFDKVLKTYEEAAAHLQFLMENRADIHAFRITRETITTSFTAYQPITNPII